MIQALDVITEARLEGQTDPYVVLGRLKTWVGLTDDRAREILRDEGYEIDDLVDARFDSLSRADNTGGFVRRLC